ncbi:hypothetical protein [Streptosporangium subroseum]|uniref:hypothetical protein n=1 Tax=Streptosporangium subroseum TaxID=106412 RepID=UPI00308AA8E5|nr:hypothetical protein OHB15_41540 [Streptosporangium subroseum]
MMDWTPRAEAVTHPDSRWRGAIASTPRHVFVPNWFTSGGEGYTLHNGPKDEEAWLDAAYSNRSLVTKVGTLHADHAGPDDRPVGWPTSSSN